MEFMTRLALTLQSLYLIWRSVSDSWRAPQASGGEVNESTVAGFHCGLPRVRAVAGEDCVGATHLQWSGRGGRIHPVP